MRKLFSIIGIVCCLVAVAPAQRQQRRDAQALVHRNKPAVFISFLRTIELEPLRTGYGRKQLLFRITNNTRWPIWFDMSGVPTKEYGDAALFYTIEGKDGKVQDYERCHVCSMNPVGSGRSLVFSIPADYISRDTLLRIAYSFGWDQKNETAGSRSTHSVEFYFNSLPNSILTDGTS
jgi:hypothetical protein